MNKFSIASLLTLCAFFSAFAQRDFRPGFVILNSGDTLLGKVDFTKERILSTKCKFQTRDGELREYTPNQILGYRFNDGKYFVSKQVDGESVFLEFLLNGEVDLYRRKVKNGKNHRYYLEKEKEPLAEVPYSEKYVSSPGSNVKRLYRSTLHYGVLKHYMSSSEHIDSKIDNVKKPGYDNLINLVQDYHNTVCEDEECIVYSRVLPKGRVFLGVNSGVSRYVREQGVSPSYVFDPGLSVFVWLPRQNEKVYLESGLHFYQYEGESFNVGRYVTEKYSFVKIPLMINYFSNYKKVGPIIGGGLSIFGSTGNTQGGLGFRYALKGGLTFSLTNGGRINLTYKREFGLPGDLDDFDLSDSQFNTVNLAVLFKLKKD